MWRNRYHEIETLSGFIEIPHNSIKTITMKKLTVTILVILLLISCKTEKKGHQKSTETKSGQLTPISDTVLESAVIYEANIRQYSPEGTFDAFTKDIPKLKALGVKIIWVMPIFPISETRRKAKGDLFVSDIKDKSERKKYLGSYYAVSDFRKINPEFGTIKDFRQLLKTAHDNDMYVILDWVPNHTGWDHHWIKEHPEFYTKNAKGEITDPLNDDGTSRGWTDVADLNYNNPQLHKAMIADMLYWITQENIDGFRCDVAGSVPVSFWQEAISQLRATKDIFMLAEAWEPELMHDHLFDMVYAWEGHHIMNDIAKGHKTANDWDAYMTKIDTLYEKDDILMNFITNHDENSWNGTVGERMGDAAEAMLALTYVSPGMPLIYSGQEYGLNRRLKFFEKDSIPKTKGKMWAELEQLGQLKNVNPALNGGKKAASYTRIYTGNDENILAFQRKNGEASVFFVANLTAKPAEFSLPVTGNFKDYIKNSDVELTKNQKFRFKPWEYAIYIQK